MEADALGSWVGAQRGPGPSVEEGDAQEWETLECERGREGGEEQERADRPHRGEWCPTEEEEGLENELLWDPFGDG